ncbi:hypothetical protein CALCODRAFT_483162 [Calocera cornea HHB12733]|uniref:Jacalin-type lectin domain-containing protein n=1 Tax=Calocera cornea HHB12733 TaxID=1353952 RepID=A0A165G1P6_9BASI|nr:hypothetical protein CALCODRAFT_483162 [Calocera cornea HHB12733]
MSIVLPTEAFGIDKGKVFHDASLGDIKSIKSIHLYEGWLVDGISITYHLQNGSTKTANHLGTAKANVTIDFKSSDVLVGVSGRTGLNGYYHEKPYLNSLSFTIFDHATGKVRVEGPYGVAGPATAYHGAVFAVVGEIKSFSGLELTEKDEPINALTLVFPRSQVLNFGPHIEPIGPTLPHPFE